MPAPPAGDGFVGRAAELARLEQALDAATAGHGATALIAGPAGIGKTRLTGELAERARRRGATVLTGRCIDLVGAALPYFPLVEALRPLRGTRRPRRAAGARRACCPARRSPRPRTGNAGESQLHLFEAVRTALDRLSATAPVVLVLEDLHWADASTLDLLAFLAHAVHDGRVLIVATWRQDAVRKDDAMHRLASGLRRRRVAFTVELGPLARDELATLVARESDAPLRPELVESVCARAEGNPFFAEELIAAALRDEPELPELLQDALLADFERLQAPTRAVVRFAAAAGRAVSPAVLTAAMPLGEAQIVEALREAVDHGLLVPDRADGELPIPPRPHRRGGVRHAAAGRARGRARAPRPRPRLRRRARRRAGGALDRGAAAGGGAHRVAGGRPRGRGRVRSVGGAPPPRARARPVGSRTARGAGGRRGDADRCWTGPARWPVGAAASARLGVVEARELYPLAVVLESIAIRRSPAFEPAAIEGLREANRRMRAAVRDPAAAMLADDDFHARLTAGCASEPLLAVLRPVKRALLRYEQVYMDEPARVERSVAQHDEIVRALERGDHAEAAQRLRRNLTGGLPDLTDALEAR